MTSHPHDPAHHLARVFKAERIRSDNAFMTHMILTYADRIKRNEVWLREWAAEERELAEVRDLAGGAVRVIKEEEE